MLDEAQAIKNHLSRTSRACVALKAKYRWVVSGTPAQTNLTELYPYLKFLKFPETDTFRAFKSEYMRAKETQAETLNERVSKFIIRRIYVDTILDHPLVDLPPRSSKDVALIFSESERSFYNELEERIWQKISKILQNAKRKVNTEATKRLILKLILRLQQLVVHSFLVGHLLPRYVWKSALDKFIQDASGDKEPFNHIELANLHEKLAKKTAVVYRRRADGNESHHPPQFSVPKWFKKTDQTLLYSTKLQAIKNQIAQWLHGNPERKIIVFTQFIGIVHLLHQVCYEELWPCGLYHGRLSHKKRKNTLDEFKTDPKKSILISTLTCGGIGLNITEACRVIIVDLWWNMPVEQQAFCRVYRIGQKLQTEMVRFYVEGTIDERILALQQRKAESIKMVFKEGQGEEIRRITVDDLVDLAGGLPEDHENTEEETDMEERTDDDDDDTEWQENSAYENTDEVSELPSDDWESEERVQELFESMKSQPGDLAAMGGDTDGGVTMDDDLKAPL